MFALSKERVGPNEQRGEHRPCVGEALFVLDFFGSYAHTWLKSFRFCPGSRQKEQEVSKRHERLLTCKRID